jgi:DNA-binding NarL/FixJ family response regulator
MFKFEEDQIAVLGVCVDPPAMAGKSAELNYHAVQNGRRAIDMLRMVSFDFLLVGIKVPDMPVWDFLRHVRTAFPQQKWGLVGGPITEQQEVTARMFGSTTLFDSTPSTAELLNLTKRLREAAAASVLASRFAKTTEASAADADDSDSSQTRSAI